MFKPLLLVTAASAALLSGCVVAPLDYRAPVVVHPTAVAPAYVEPAAPAYVAPPVVVEPEPAPLVEVIPAMPYAGLVWFGGYWVLNGGHHVWTPGRWAPPGTVRGPHGFVGGPGHVVLPHGGEPHDPHHEGQERDPHPHW